MREYTDKKEKKFSHIIGNSEGSGGKSYMYGENICAFPHTVC
jgi:hypothetical protein